MQVPKHSFVKEKKKRRRNTNNGHKHKRRNMNNSHCKRRNTSNKGFAPSKIINQQLSKLCFMKKMLILKMLIQHKCFIPKGLDEKGFAHFKIINQQLQSFFIHLFSSIQLQCNKYLFTYKDKFVKF
jgi:hypothetical protein